jgi:kynureninase
VISADTSIERARELDRADDLAPFRERFAIPSRDGRAVSYLCGHSLGLMPRAVSGAIAHELDRWASLGVDGHFGADGGWYAYHERFAAPLALLTGTTADCVVAMNSLTVNLHLMLVTFFAPAGTKRRILIERGAFPSDRYAVQSHLRLHGLNPTTDLVELDLGAVPAGGLAGALDSILAAEAGRIALVLLPGVQFLTGRLLPIDALAAVARKHDVRIGFDLAHAVGNVPLDLDKADADFAVWCNYKYLNAGPGSIGGCYVNRRWHAAALPRLEGWWGHAKSRRFALEPAFAAIGTAESWQLSNPPILAMAPLAPALDAFAAAGMAALRRKSIALTGYLAELLAHVCGDRLTLLTPADPAERGCQLSLQLDLGALPPADFMARLAAEGVVADWREPDVLRLAPVPLYNRFEDVQRAATAIGRALGR